MKKLTYILLIFTLIACDSENANDCFQTAGTTIQEFREVPEFSRILVNRDITLIVEEADEYAVLIETGSNLLNDVMALVVNDQLILTDDNTCNFVRDFGITKITVFTPTLTEIRTSTQYETTSNGILNFENLTLISESFNMPGTFTMGDFRLSVASNNIDIVANGLSSFYLDGSVNNLRVRFFAGAGRFEGRNLIAQNVNIFHRGGNDMIVNPQQSIIGQIVSTGDVIAINQPPNVEVEVLFTGQLIFN
ncbi:head GIN domain-containing protein [Paucihalobacter sp.]|uniref:head GIN domain-containing protein n=1 Tax=Paucihalobacter sp. TaxID=2850405 RepID=UPI002FE2DFD7